MKKKGFTLIELLAVIVILAIIALIVTPVISRIIEKTKKEAFRQSVVGVIQSGEYYISKYLIENNGADITYPMTFTCDGESCSHDEATLTFNGATPKGGRIIVESRKEVVAEYITDGKYCASGTKWNLQVATNCSDIDTTSPIISGSLEGKVIHISITEEESGVKGYCVNTSEDSNSCNWIDNNNKNIDHELESAGTYYVFARDNKDNISNRLEFTADIDAFCSYEAGHEFATITNVGMTEFEAPCKGLYKLEVWGAAGGSFYNSWSASGKGGYSSGYVVLGSGTKLYIAVGGAGSAAWCENECNYGGAYNGGGPVRTSGSYVGGGGGATHIAKVTGTLASIGYDSFVTQGNGLIVAGGGGGGMAVWSKYGGSGGGLNGGGGSDSRGTCTSGATQTAGGSGAAAGSFGTGGSGSSYRYSGGGGLYGGSSGYESCGASGGSGYIGGVPEIEYNGVTYSPSTSNGVNSSNGYAKITLIKY